MPPLHVLFVDDDDSLHLLASAMLNTKEFRLFSAHTSREADQILQRSQIDLIVCDVMMPEEDGIQFCKRLNQRGIKIPIMMLSACGDPMSVQKGLEAGAGQYLVKPFDIADLKARMLAMAGRKLSSETLKTNDKKGSGIKLLSWLKK